MMHHKNILSLQRFSGEGEETGDTTQPDAGAETGGDLSFEALLKEKPAYKAAYDARVKRAIAGRFRQMKELEAHRDRTDPVLKAVAKRYGLTWEAGGDTEPLLKALEAPHNGPDREQLRSQVAAMRGRFPGFHLGRELENPAFARLVAAGTPLEAAYRLTHERELLERAMGYAIGRTRQSLSDRLRAGQNRPGENGMKPRQSPQAAPDPKSLTAQERKSLRSRVARGEKVYW